MSNQLLQSPPVTPAGSAPARNPWPDNVKALLISLVVVGHTLSRGLEQSLPSAHAVYLFVYLFHMPAFVFLAGHFASSRELSGRQLQTIVTRVLAPYLVFSVLYAAARYLAGGERLQVDLVDPWWLLWFLPALAGWRLLAPVLLNLRAPLVVSLGLGLGVGAVDRVGADFTLSRIVALLPFFVLGALTTPERLRLLRQPVVRWAGAALLVTTAAVVGMVHGRFDASPHALYWNSGYSAQHTGMLEGLAVRGFCYLVGAVLTFAILAVVSGRRTWVASVGAASLYVYLLHGFAARAAARSGLLDHVDGVATVALACIVAVGVALVLGSPPVRRLARPFVEPRLGRLLRPSGEPPALRAER